MAVILGTSNSTAWWCFSELTWTFVLDLGTQFLQHFIVMVCTDCVIMQFKPRSWGPSPCSSCFDGFTTWHAIIQVCCNLPTWLYCSIMCVWGCVPMSWLIQTCSCAIYTGTVPIKTSFSCCTCPTNMKKQKPLYNWCILYRPHVYSRIYTGDNSYVRNCTIWRIKLWPNSSVSTDMLEQNKTGWTKGAVWRHERNNSTLNYNRLVHYSFLISSNHSAGTSYTLSSKFHTYRIYKLFWYFNIQPHKEYLRAEINCWYKKQAGLFKSCHH